MIIYATVQYLRSSWLINYFFDFDQVKAQLDVGAAALSCQPQEVWRIALVRDAPTASDLCALMLWGGDHPSTLQPGRIIKSVVRL